jgi:hypothetical protein
MTKPRVYQIKRQFVDNPEKLANQLEELMHEHARRANRAEHEAREEPRDPQTFTNAQIEVFLEQRAAAGRAHMLNEGYRHGLNKAWKLIFGTQSFRSLIDE